MRIEEIGSATLVNGDCREVMAAMPENSMDSIVCDPPYGLSFMGKGWDHGVPGAEFWTGALRVAKPGAYLLAFGGTRTHHRLMVAIEDAGWEIRDVVMWVYGSGFPKSHNGEWGGTALKPAWEPIILARKPLIGTVAANVQQYGTGGLNIDGCRVEGVKGTPASPRRAEQNAAYSDLGNDPGTGSGRDANVGRWPANLIHDGSEEVLACFPESNGSGPARTLQRSAKPDQVGWGMNKNAPDDALLPDAGSGSAARFFYCAKASKSDRDEGCDHLALTVADTAHKIPRSELDDPRRAGTVPRKNSHPTVKPTALMRYLCRLVTPTGGIVLDPFMGSGSTGKAALQEGFKFVGIDNDVEHGYFDIACARIRVACKL